MKQRHSANILTAMLMAQSLLSFGQNVITIRNDGGDKQQLKNPQPVIGRVLYNFSYMKDTTKRDYYYKEVFELDYAKNTSYFTSYTQKENDSLMKNQIESAFKNAPDPNHVDIKITGNASATRDKFFTDNSDHPAVYEIKQLVRSTFIISATHPKIDWRIIDSTKTIKGYLCQKATGNSYGRLYTAWFCTDLPYNFGPRRLNGLPGLILEAYDDKMEVIYKLSRVENFNTNIEAIGLPQNAEATTSGDFDKAEEAFRRNPQAFMDANRNKPSGNSGGIAKGDGLEISKIKSMTITKTDSNAPKISMNNPIDLIKD